MPIQNIPVVLVMLGVLYLCFAMLWQDHKDNKHAEQVKQVRKCEHVRRAYRLIERGRHERKYNKYHGLV